MPRGYQRHATGPMHTSGTFVAPTDDVANAVLRANAAATNPEPFTPEHYAAYHAFASVTDRRDAIHLHRHHVTWDDVNEYGQAGLPFTDYRLMTTLADAGVTPAVLRTWHAVIPNLAHHSICTFTRANLTPTQVKPYLTPHGTGRTATAPVRTLDHDTIPNLIRAGITATRAHHYRVCGIPTTKGMLELHNNGCRPAVLYAMTRNRSPYLTHSGLVQDTFPAAYRKARRTGATADFCNEMFAMGATLATIDTWHATGAPAAAVGLLHGAGITPAEYTADPTIADDPDALAALAALRGHTVRSRTNAMLAA